MLAGFSSKYIPSANKREDRCICRKSYVLTYIVVVYLYPSTSHTCTCCGCCYNVGTIAIALQRENTPTIDRIKLIREQRKSGGNSLACGGNRGHAVLHQSCSAAQHGSTSDSSSKCWCWCCLLAVFRPPSYVYQLPTCTLGSRFGETPRLMHGTAFSRLVGGCGGHMQISLPPQKPTSSIIHKEEKSEHHRNS